jgi:hypothetical protein
MAHQANDDREEQGSHPAPPADRGEIDAGVAPQEAVDGHPAEGVQHQHDLEGDIVPVDTLDDLSDHTSSPTENGKGGTA